MHQAKIPPYTLCLPHRRSSPVIFASPHSGRSYSPDFMRQTRLGPLAIRSSEDAYVDLLFGAAPDFGSPLLCATAPRAFVDLNRSPHEIDADLVEGQARAGASIRARAGYGVIPRRVGDGVAIYSGMLAATEARERIRRFHHPYHARMDQLISESICQFGEAILFDCHSMPHRAAKSLVPGHARPPEVILGDRFGQAAAGDLVDHAEAAFVAAGLSVARNAPFSGAYISRRYGRPPNGRHVIQIEIDRNIYLDETTLRPGRGFGPLRALLRTVVADLAAIRPAGARMAAE